MPREIKKLAMLQGGHEINTFRKLVVVKGDKKN